MFMVVQKENINMQTNQLFSTVLINQHSRVTTTDLFSLLCP